MLTLKADENVHFSSDEFAGDNLDSLKILIVEDDRIYQRWMAKIVENFGSEVFLSSNGTEAIEILKKEPISIVISDLCMPDTDGIELTRHVRNLKLDRYVHIIMVTSREDEEDRRQALSNGVDDFITKGTNPSILLARLRTACRMVRHEEELAQRHEELKAAVDHIQRDLAAASTAQKSLLPKLDERFADVIVRSQFQASSFVSGDMFGCFAFEDGFVGFYIVDVAGHGVRSSLNSVAIGHLITKEYFRRNVIGGDGNCTPADLVKELNARFAQQDGDDYFTMICGVIDTSRDLLHFCQAGHPSPLLAVPGSPPIAVGQGGMPVGMFDFAQYQNGMAVFPPGSVLLVCSDAATEAENPEGAFFGDVRLSAFMSRALSENSKTMTEDLVEELNAWRQGAPLEDDLTLIEFDRRH